MTFKIVGLSTCAILGLSMAILAANPAQAVDQYVRELIASNKVQICEFFFTLALPMGGMGYA
jgi:hypothetical protein